MSTTYEMKHRAIVNAAIEVFLKLGYERTSVDHVAREAGISKVTLYNHFKDKKALFESVMVVHCQRLSKGKKLIEFDPKLSPKVQLTKFGQRFVTALLDKRSISLMRLVIAEAGRFREFAEAIWPGGKMPLLEELVSYLKAEVKAGRLRITNFDIAARQFSGLIKENLVWPALLGVEYSTSADHQDDVIRSAVSMFLAIYERA